MESHKRLKDLRDALWQAAIESTAPSSEEPIDPYSKFPDEIAAELASAGFLSDAEARAIISFLDQYSPDDEENPIVQPAELPDDLDTHLTAIIAKLRSIRLAGDQDIGGLGPGGGEGHAVQKP